MTLDRNALVNGRAYAHHAVSEVTHNYDGRFTRIGVTSWNSDDEWVSHSLDMPLSDGMDEAAAYEAVSAALPEWDDPRDALDEVLSILTDEQAETVTDAFPQWSVGTQYAVGARVRHGGLLYRCVQAHASQADWAPDVASSLWARTASGDVPDWVQPTGAHDAYARGDRVRYKGEVWVSDIDANVYAPDVFGWVRA